MNDHDLELLSAFFDGERVDAARLAELLGDAEAVEALREFARLRARVAGEDAAPRSAWVAATRAKLGALDRPAPWRRWVPVPAPALAAAGLLVALVAAWGWRGIERGAAVTVERPPVAARTIAFEVGKDWHSMNGTPSGKEATR